MKVLLVSLLAAMPVSPSVLAQVDGDDSILAKRGDGIVYHEQFDARVARIPEAHRLTVIRDKTRLEEIVNDMLRMSQMAAAAREAGYDKDPMVQARIALAEDEELAAAWLQHFVAQSEPGDYRAMAREYWQVNKARYKTEKAIDVSHILIGKKDRAQEEALERANSIYAQLLDDPGKFDTLVMEYSDDPSAAQNNGKFKNVERGDMVKPFENAAFALQVGQISKPAQTQYGFHIIRLDDVIKPRQKSFKEVQFTIENQMRAEHQDRIQNDYLSSLHALDIEMTEESLESMVIRQFGEDAVKDSSGEP